MSFTKGPWEVFNKDEVRCGDRRIASCMPQEGWMERVTESSFDEDKANAQLIAAAPDLYNALKEIMDATDNDEFDRGFPDNHDWIGFEEARVALNKARGE